MMIKKKTRLSIAVYFIVVSLCVFMTIAATLAIMMSLATFLYYSGILHSRNRVSMIIILFISCCIVGTIIGLIFFNHPTKRFYDLIDGMDKLSKGDFSYRIKRHNLTRLDVSFNKMAEELENTEVLRTDFINDFSHEFKTPIVSLMGFAKLLKYSKTSEEKRSEYIDIIVEESERLSQMAENILEMTRIDNQKILTDVTEYNLSEQIRKCILELEKKWTAKNIDMNPDFAEFNIKANKNLMKQVWINLIDNAIKFSDKNEEIKISILSKAEGIYVKISDIGVLIKEEDISRIFGKFYQADKSHSQKGTGTGLAVCKKIVELHNGSIKVESSEVRTVFTVFIPQ